MESVINALRERYRSQLDQAFHATEHARDRLKQSNDLTIEATINTERAAETADAIAKLGGEVPEWVDPVERRRRSDEEKQAKAANEAPKPVSITEKVF